MYSNLNKNTQCGVIIYWWKKEGKNKNDNVTKRLMDSHSAKNFFSWSRDSHSKCPTAFCLIKITKIGTHYKPVITDSNVSIY